MTKLERAEAALEAAEADVSRLKAQLAEYSRKMIDAADKIIAWKALQAAVAAALDAAWERLSVDQRLAIVYSHGDLLGALAKDLYDKTRKAAVVESPEEV